jgi:DNA-binding NtrC family response regulator
MTMRQESELIEASGFAILVIDDDPVQCRLVEASVARAGGRTERAGGLEAAFARLTDPALPAFDALVLDLMMPDGYGLDLLTRLRATGLQVPPTVVQTSRAGIDTVVEAMRAGACDFLVKPASPAKITAAIAAACRAGQADGGEGASGRSTLAAEPGIETPTGHAPGRAMAETLRLADKAARSAIPVLLQGETGTGKEWLARRIVEAGPRAGAPFVAVNCGALPRDLAESILFGHERGAFTGATQRSLGRFGEADGGTLFLDEVGELAPEVQVKLLRALQEGEIDPVGASRPVRTDLRIIAATHRDLARDVADGRFREDLFYRLAVFPIALPPLRDRRDEIAALARAFALQFAGVATLAEDALRFLESQDWPGNIRQLQNAVHRAAVLAEGEVLTAADFGLVPSSVVEPSADGDGMRAAEPVFTDPAGPFATGQEAEPEAGYRISLMGGNGEIITLAAAEKRLIAAAIDRYEGRLSAVARHLGIGRSTLYRKMRSYGLDRFAQT